MPVAPRPWTRSIVTPVYRVQQVAQVSTRTLTIRQPVAETISQIHCHRITVLLLAYLLDEFGVNETHNFAERKHHLQIV